jgi:hypothetical protein
VSSQRQKFLTFYSVRKATPDKWKSLSLQAAPAADADPTRVSIAMFRTRASGAATL